MKIEACIALVKQCTSQVRESCRNDDTDDYLLKLERLIIERLRKERDRNPD